MLLSGTSNPSTKTTIVQFETLNATLQNMQLYRSVLMTELLDGFIIYLTKMLGAKAETDLYDTKCQLYEARMLNRFSETLMQLFFVPS